MCGGCKVACTLEWTMFPRAARVWPVSAHAVCICCTMGGATTTFSEWPRPLRLNDGGEVLPENHHLRMGGTIICEWEEPSFAMAGGVPMAGALGVI